MKFDLDYPDLVRLLEACGCEYQTASVVADYLDEFVGELDLTQYIWNTLMFHVHVFDSKDEALDFIRSEGVAVEDCTVYECSCCVGVYVELP